MADLVQVPVSRRNSKMSNKNLMKSLQVASFPKCLPKKTFKHVKNLVLEDEHIGQVVLFLVKAAALEVVRRISKRKCPAVWHFLQSLQVLNCPPLKWIQRWTPFKTLVKGIQVIARPLFFVSVATACSDHLQRSQDSLDNNAQDPELRSDTNSADKNSADKDSGKRLNKSSDVATSDKNNMVQQLHRELEKQGIFLPERISDDELCKFHTAANGDLSCFLQSVKRSIHWRENYKFLSTRELETWSHLVFWHGSDLKQRPCLFIRLGLACSSVVPDERSHFTNAIVSQIEHGVLCLVNGSDTRITVLMDCEGLSPLRFPTKMLRSCSTLMQDHYPNQLAALFIIRLPPVTRVIAQTVIQVLKPGTKKKLQILGDTYQNVLAEFFECLPSFMGGSCTCSKCCLPSATNFKEHDQEAYDICMKQESDKESSYEKYRGILYSMLSLPIDRSSFFKIVVVAIVMVWIVLFSARRLYYV